MKTYELAVDIKIKYPRLLFWLNAPVVLLGFKPIVPRWIVLLSPRKVISE